MLLSISVADPGGLSRILIFTHSGSRIKKQQQSFFCSHTFHKIKNYFIF
jgi:hypothetical protein